MASAPPPRVPVSMPAHPSLALLASLSAIAIDAALRKQPFNPEPVAELARVLESRVSGSGGSVGPAAKLLDPETTGLLSTALETDEPTVEGLAREGAQIAADLRQPLDHHTETVLRKLRAFALRLSAAAQEEDANNPPPTFASPHS